MAIAEAPFIETPISSASRELKVNTYNVLRDALNANQATKHDFVEGKDHLIFNLRKPLTEKVRGQVSMRVNLLADVVTSDTLLEVPYGTDLTLFVWYRSMDVVTQDRLSKTLVVTPDSMTQTSTNISELTPVDDSATYQTVQRYAELIARQSFGYPDLSFLQAPEWFSRRAKIPRHKRPIRELRGPRVGT